MKANFTDVWSVILDDNARPLVGKIEFCEPNTTTLKEIYDDTENPTDNPIYVNKRTTNQVLLGEGDYTVRYYRYIGKGNMESDNNEDSWFNYKTELVKGQVSTSTISSSTTVNTIAELKDIIANDGDVVNVVGYYEVNDCPNRQYVWYSNISSSLNDGGVYISSNNTTTGCWKMKVPGSYIDVRWYGDLPDEIQNPTASQQKSNLGQRAAAADMANAMGKDLYFPKGYYIFDGSNTVAVNKDIICDNNVKFVVKSGTNGTKVSCHELHKCDANLFISNDSSQIGGYELTADWIRTSWFSYSTAAVSGAKVGYILDYDPNRSAPLAFNNCSIEVIGNNNYDINLNNVQIISCPGLLKGNVSVQYMDIKQEWFEIGYDYSNLVVNQGCDTKLSYCNSANDYVMLKNKCVKYDYGDLGEQTVNNIEVYAGGTLENCYGTIILKNNGSYEFHNVSVGITGIDANKSINAIDSWITVSDSANVIDSLQLRRGSLTSDTAIQVLDIFEIYDADVNTYIKLYGKDNFTIENCKIMNTIDIIGHNDYRIANNTFANGSKVTYIGDSNIIYGTFKNNIINSDSLGWHFSSNVANTKVNISWIDNHSDMDEMFIYLDRTNLDNNEENHNYTFEGNTGKNVIQRYPSANIDTVAKSDGDNPVTGAHVYFSNGYYYGTVQGTISETNRNYYIGDFYMFTIGKNGVKRQTISSLYASNYNNASLTYGCIGYVSSDKNASAEALVNIVENMWLVNDNSYNWRLGSIRSCPVFFGGNLGSNVNITLNVKFNEA